MALPPDERLDRAKVNEAVRQGLALGPLRPAGYRGPVRRSESDGIGKTAGREPDSSGATAENYLKVPSPFRRSLCRDRKSKRGIHNRGNGD
jgi:hypothetical protein